MGSTSSARPRAARARAAAIVLGSSLALLVAWGGYLRSPAVRHEVKSRLITTDEIGIWRTDPVLGYRHEPHASGRQSLAESFDVAYTIDRHGNRVTPDPENERGRVLALGGSFTFGHGVEDHEAWPFVLGELCPEVKVVSRGVAGFGTAQALLCLEEELERGEPPDLVLYGWIPDHRARNYVRRSWVETMAHFGRTHPRFELGEDGLEYRGVVGPEEAVPDDAPGLDETERRLTVAMVRRMIALCDEAGVPFVLLRFGQGDDAWLLELPELRWLELNDVGGGVLPFDGHPNAAWHTHVARALEPLLAEVVDVP